MDHTIDVSSTPILRIHKNHPQSQIIGKSTAGVLTRRKLKESASDQHQALLSFIYKQNRTNHKDQQTCLFACFLSQEEPKKVSQALADESWMKRCKRMLQFKYKSMGICGLPVAWSDWTKWVFRKQRGMKRWRVKSAFDMEHHSDVYVKKPPGLEVLLIQTKSYRVVRHFMVTFKHQGAWFQVTPKVSHMHAVKRIFRYLKHQPKLGLWYPKDSPFHLEAFSDSDYAGDNHDRRSTSGGCQYLGRRLVSWQCKKQTIVAISSTEAEYVAAASCCAQVLWMQNQLLDYGFNFMNTEIHIDNESTICIVKNHVLHSKTKHIQIRHHFIRDCYEQRLILWVKCCSASILKFTADFQGTTEAQGAADIPQSPNDYTPTDASQTSGGDEGLLDLYALNRELILWVKSQKLKKRGKKQKKKVSSVKLGRNKDEGNLSEEHHDQDEHGQDDHNHTAFVYEDFDATDAVVADLERKSDETEERKSDETEERKSDETEQVIIEEEKDTSDVKSGDTEELDLERIQSTARQSAVTPRTLNFDDEAGPSSPIRPTQEEEPEEQFKDDEFLADIPLNINRPRGLSIPGPMQSQPQQPTQTTDPKEKGKGILVEEPKKMGIIFNISELWRYNDVEVARKVSSRMGLQKKRENKTLRRVHKIEESWKADNYLMIQNSRIARSGMEVEMRVKIAIHIDIEFNMKDAEARHQPLGDHFKLIGSMMYAMVCTRQDIAHALGVVSRFMSNPGREHWEAVKWLLRYLKGTSNDTLCFSKKEVVLEGFSDSDYRGCLDSGKSTTGYIFTVGGTTVSWMSIIQKCVAMSTTEAEYMAITEAGKELVWLKIFLEELDRAQTECVLFCDNQSAIHLVKNLKILGAKNPVDMLTKVVTTEKLKLCAALTGLRDN
ncbi:hypothetical protein Tco_0210467 [Tanacetum coccineum]